MSNVILSNLFNFVADAMDNEILTQQTTLYSFIGKTSNFTGDDLYVKDNFKYNNLIRDNIVFAKRVPSTDTSFIINKYEWESGVIYDQYDDDYYGSRVTEIEVTNGGSGYHAGSTTAYVTGGGGTGVQLLPNISGGVIIGIGVTDGGINFTSVPTVVIVDTAGNTTDAIASAGINANNLAHSGVCNLKDAMFYVVTSDFNVYKCLYNNVNSASINMPTHTTIDPVVYSDGYIWKFMYHIQLGLRKKFLTPAYMPCYTALSSSFYSDGGIDYVEVSNGGSGYVATTPLKVYAVGDGIHGKFSGRIDLLTKEIADVKILDSGRGYYSTTTKNILSISRTTNVATITTDTAHNLVVGTSFTVSGTSLTDGVFVVSSVINNNSFTYASSGTNIISTTLGNVGFTTAHSKAITSISRDKNVVTVATSTPHFKEEGNIISINGVTGFNGNYTISDYISTTSFTFYQFGDDDIVLSTGTIEEEPLGIANLTRTSNVVTVTTNTPHNFRSPFTISSIARATNVVTVVTTTLNYASVGDVFTISGTTAFNGNATVVSIVSGYSFTYNAAGANSTETTGLASQYIVLSGTGGVADISVKIASVVNSTSFTFAQTGAAYSSYSECKLVYNTTLALSSNSGVSGKYSPNTTAKLSPNILLRNGIGYTGAPSVYIYSTTGINAAATAIVVGTTVTQINMTNNGTGYTTKPEIYFKGGSTHQAAATANMSGGLITTISMTNNGSGYYSAPKVLIVGNGTGATATAVLVNGEITDITVDTHGTGYTSADVYFTGTSDYCCAATANIYNNTVKSITIDSTIDSIAIIDPGVNYDDGAATTIEISGDGINGYLTPIIVDGAIDSVFVSNEGEGYSYADLTVVGGGSDAKLTTVLNTTNIIGQGDTSQYNTEALAINGTIDAIVVTYGGAGYTTATVTITGSGSGATASATILNGIITKILVTNRGADYTNATVTITGDGASATARAILPPVGGHGKNALRELFASNLMIYSKVSNSDIYNDYNFSNAYYQYGIMVDPTQYNSTKKCTASVISTCVSVSGVFSLSDFLLNDIVKITVSAVDHLYKIVDILATKMLLQPYDDYIPLIGNVVTNVGNSISFTIISVDLPTMNLSGGMLIDANNVTGGFYKTASQIITSRTLIGL